MTLSGGKAVLSLAIVLALGISIGWMIRGSDAGDIASEPSVRPNPTPVNVGRLQALTETELEEYARLKTLEERYKKADELLGKMVGIFLADLGVRIAPQTLKAMSEFKPEPVKPSFAESAVAVPMEKKNVATTESHAFSSRRPLNEVRSEQEIEEFLEASKIKDFQKALESSAPLGNQALLGNLSGRFTGSSNVTKDDRPQTWIVDFNFRGRIEDGKLMGRYGMQLSENGKIFSNRNGNGNLSEDVRELSSDPNAIVVEVTRDMYAQLYYIKDSDAIIGHFVQRERRGSAYKTLGSMYLRRSR